MARAVGPEALTWQCAAAAPGDPHLVPSAQPPPLGCQSPGPWCISPWPSVLVRQPTISAGGHHVPCGKQAKLFPACTWTPCLWVFPIPGSVFLETGLGFWGSLQAALRGLPHLGGEISLVLNCPSLQQWGYRFHVCSLTQEESFGASFTSLSKAWLS